jgi:DNA primase
VKVGLFPVLVYNSFMSMIDEVKARIDAVELISETVKLRRAGKNYTGFCPFHPNSRTPAFVVFPDSGTWRCFGQCNEGGDIFRFVMKKEGWDFRQALQFLAQRAGVELEPQTPEKQEEDKHTERLRGLLEEAVNFYRHYLLRHPSGQAALAYLKKRGLTPATIETFGLGYAPEGWETAVNYFSNKNYSADDLLQCGLVSERQQGGGVHDRFRNRIMFPIRDAMGKMCGFGARILDPNDVPKFLNSPQTALFDKGRLLYGLDQARKPIRAQDQVVIVEGYLDVIVLHQAGYPNTVSPMGTALSEDQLRMLKKFTRRIVLALDADAAGEKATLRGLDVARQAMDRSDTLAFDARGLLHHEARLQADLRVTTLPEGSDPDEVVLRDPAEWQRILDAARPVVTHVMETLAAGQNLDDPKVKSAIAAQVLPLIDDVPDAVERDAYRQRLARLLRVDERSLVVRQATAARPARRKTELAAPPGKRAAQPPAATSARLAEQLEQHILRLLLRQPDALYPLDRSLQELGLSRFSAQELESGGAQSLASLLLQGLEQEDMDAPHYIRQNVPEELEALYEQLLAALAQGEPNAEALAEDLFRTLIRLRSVRVEESLNQIRFLQEEAQQQGETGSELYNEMFIQFQRTRARLDQARKKNVISED